MILVLVAFIPTFFGQPYLQLLAVFAVDIFHVGPDGLGMLTAAAAIGAMAGALVLALVPTAGRRGRFMLLVMLVYGLLICGFSLTDNFRLAAVTLLAVGACQIMCNATNNILLQTIVPDAVRGRVLSVLSAQQGPRPAGNSRRRNAGGPHRRELGPAAFGRRRRRCRRSP